MLDITEHYEMIKTSFTSRFWKARRKGGKFLKLNFEESFQDFLVELLQKQKYPKSRFDPSRSSLVTYIWLVADSSIYRQLVVMGRQKNKGGELGEEEDAVLGLQIEDPRGLSDESVDLHKTLSRVIAELSNKDQELLNSYYFEGLKLDDIADRLGCTRQRAGQLVTKALTRARKKLDTVS